VDWQRGGVTGAPPWVAGGRVGPEGTSCQRRGGGARARLKKEQGLEDDDAGTLALSRDRLCDRAFILLPTMNWNAQSTISFPK
jgi:hypothetical protein